MQWKGKFYLHILNDIGGKMFILIRKVHLTVALKKLEVKSEMHSAKLTWKIKIEI